MEFIILVDYQNNNYVLLKLTDSACIKNIKVNISSWSPGHYLTFIVQ